MNHKAMYKISYGLYVLTAREGEKDNGCIINTAIQVTTSPNRVSITVNKQNKTHDMIMETGLFNVSSLTEEVPFSVIKHFGFQSGRDVEKLEEWEGAMRTENGLYAVAKYTNAYISAKVMDSIDLGTHTMFLADVTGAEVFSEVPSLTYGFYQSNIKPKPEKTKKTGYRCRICGYIYEGEPLPEDFVCPVCKHGAADFVKIE